jgi:hypothetical protein
MLRVRGYRARFTLCGPWSGGLAPMQLASAPTSNGRVLTGCSLAGFSEAPLTRPIRAETSCMARFGKRPKVSLIHY